MPDLPAFRRLVVLLFILLTLLPCLNITASAAAKRIVVIKVDGLSSEMVDRFVRQRNTRTGKSMLPWFEHVFYERGTRVANFYVRGISLSAPSWSMLDTGQHLQLKGNVEFDRFTLHSYDYLNFIPFYLGHAVGRRVDMPGPEVLDELGIPLLVDAYPYTERHMSFQLFQRGTRWTTLQRGLQNSLARNPRELLDEFTLGFERRSIISEQLERELLEKLQDARFRYLDYYVADFDHATHHNRDAETHLDALVNLDSFIGRVWTTIQNSPLAAETALILVSDHGTNTDERIYSQGYNLVKLLGSRAGGGHHVVTKRRLLASYALKGVYPLVPLIYTTTDESYYLKGQSTEYPTALLDFDGNERAAIHLRDSDLNVLHILLQQLKRQELSPDLRRAATNHFFRTLERRRADWQRKLTELNDELTALRRSIAKQRLVVEAQPKKWSKADQDAGRDQASRRLFAQMELDVTDERTYTEYARTLHNLLELTREQFDSAHMAVEDVIAKGAMGDSNTTYSLQNYVVGLAPGGLTLAADGTLDAERSFTSLNYFEILHGIAVRNNVQQGISNHPIDFIAIRLEAERVNAILNRDDKADDVVWLYGGPDKQALILARRSPERQLWLRYLPIAGLTATRNGAINFKFADWQNGLPLKIWEDEKFGIEAEHRTEWLQNWHTDLEWLRAAHQTEYSNAVVGLHEHFARHLIPALDPNEPGLTADERLTRRFRRRQRRLVESDLLILASKHWNFDVRGFNPGGNHGSFFRASTHSTLMFSGGKGTGVPRGRVVEEPYDSLSFMPTVLALTNQLTSDARPVPVLWEAGFHSFPGRIIKELFPSTKAPDADPPVAGGQ